MSAMPLYIAGSQIVFTTLASNTYSAIIVGQVESWLVGKNFFFVIQHASDEVHMPIADYRW